MPAENCYYVYLLTNWNNKVMYVGVTNDLRRRIYEHQNKLLKWVHAEIQRQQVSLLRTNE